MDADLVVVGGGPAGAVSALLGARDGLRVVLIDPCRPLPRLEGLGFRLRDWLGRQGMLRGFNGVIGPLPRRVDWAGMGESNSEFVVLRGDLDAHLRGLAEQAGVRILPTSARIEGDSILLADGARLGPRWIIDARGRAARRAGGTQAPATLAICGWLGGAYVTQEEPGIRITALATGWLWRVALPDGRIWAQYVTDAAGDGTPEERLTDALRQAELGPGAGPQSRRARLSLTAAPHLREAAPVLPAAIEDLRILPVGDALAAMDPLSGHGQFWAVSGALAVAAARRSLIAEPGAAMQDLCLRFLRLRAGETAMRQARIGRDFLRSETRYAASPFWMRRQGFPDDLPAHPQRADFATATQPVIQDGLLREIPVLLTPRSPGGVGWFGSVPAVQAYAAFRQGGPAALHAAWPELAPALLAAIDSESRPLST